MIRDVLVHLAGGAFDANNLAHADMLASTFGAHVAGLYTNVLSGPVLTGDMAVSAMLMAELIDQSKEVGDRAAAILAKEVDALAASNEFRRLDIFAARLGATIADHARSADLTVLTRPYDSEGPSRDAGPVEAALFESGRGVYVVPPGKGPKAIETVLIGWRNSRETARAIAEALPILARARQVALAVVDEDGPAEEQHREPAADMARHLDRHGVRVELRHLPKWESVGAALLNEARSIGADLLVAGGYGHSRLREWMFGGTTRELLTLSEIPLLMAH